MQKNGVRDKELNVPVVYIYQVSTHVPINYPIYCISMITIIAKCSPKKSILVANPI